MKVFTVEELVAHIRPRRNGKKFLADFLNECTVEEAIIIPKGATRREVFDIFNKVVYKMRSCQPTYKEHTAREIEEWWNQPYTEGWEE